MEFWGVEVKAGQSFKVQPGVDRLLHLSQASLGEPKKVKGNESVPLFAKVDNQKLVIGTLSTEKCQQITYDLVFEKEFELSHNWANGSVYFLGYKSVTGEDGEEDSSDNESDSEEDIPLAIPMTAEENGLPEQKVVPSKPSTDNAKSKVKVAKPIKQLIEKEEDTDSDDDEDEDDSEDGVEDEGQDESDDEEITDSSDEEDDDSSDDEDEGSSDEEDAITPKKAEQNKKRPAPVESDTKNPAGKKAKLVTPQKTGGEGKKSSGHVSTPYPSKQSGKTPANNDKSKQQTPASNGSSSKSFKSNQARKSHSKGKHGAHK